MAVITTQQLTKQFGGLVAIDHLDLEVREQSIHSVIGPNGAGKTTVFNMITGVYTPTRNDIYLFGEKITGLKPHRITRQGIARTFQNIRLFS
ncbi:MAG TPA: ATP-binding cassette domain-containing protein, partial [Phycisphaerae bacterium]|nr:ATP-binding cassette domain-containing protein [Phycisphaerae bacterium]